MATFDPPTSTVVHVNGESAYFYNLPVPTHFVTQQYFPDESLGAQGEQDCFDGFFEVAFGEVGRFEFTLSAPGYDDLFVDFTSLPPEPEE